MSEKTIVDLSHYLNYEGPLYSIPYSSHNIFEMSACLSTSSYFFGSCLSLLNIRCGSCVSLNFLVSFPLSLKRCEAEFYGREFQEAFPRSFLSLSFPLKLDNTG